MEDFGRALLPHPSLKIRLGLVASFCFGLVFSLVEITYRQQLDLPLAETILVVWALGELVARRLRLEFDRTVALYLLGTCCALLLVWIVSADMANGQAPATTIRNVLKYTILFLVVAWIALSPNKDYIAVFLLGSVVASIAVGFSVLLYNTDNPYLAKYHAPYVGLLILTAWAAGRPFNGAWRWITSAAVLLATILAIHASARWALISIGVVGIAALVPRPHGLPLRGLVFVTCAVPLLPLLALDPETAVAVMTARNLASASDVERLLLYAFAHESMLNYPIYGIGFERFLNEFEGRFGHLLMMASSVQGPHNQYAAIGALFGVPALLIYATAVASSVLLLLRLTKTTPSRLKLACLLLWGFMFLANEISDDARLALYLVAALMACGAPAQRSWLGALLPRRRDAASLPPAQLARAGSAIASRLAIAPREGSRAYRSLRPSI